MVDDCPLVSLVTPSFNQASFLEDTILSVKGQDYPRIEHIVIDGGSTDGSVEILRAYASELAYWISEPDGGSSDAVNKGWRRAQGDYLWILNSDDTFATPHIISALVQYLEEHPDIDLVYGDIFWTDAIGHIIGERIFPEYDLLTLFLDEGQLPFAGCLMRRRVLNKVGYFDTNFVSCDDFDYFIRVALAGKLGHLRQFTAYFRVHPDSSTQARLPLSAEETLRVCAKYLHSPTAPPEIRANRRRIWGRAHHYAASCYFRSGYPQQAREHLLKAFRFTPGRMLRPWLWGMLLICCLDRERSLRVRASVLRRSRRSYGG